MTSINLADRAVDLGEWASTVPEADEVFARAVRTWLDENLVGDDAAGALGALASGDSAAMAQVGMELGSKVVEKAFGEAGVLVVTQHPVRSQAEADQLAKSIFEELTSGNLQAEGLAIGSPLPIEPPVTCK